MNLLELFAGSRSIGKEADKLGFNTFSTDFVPFPNLNHVGDILDLKRSDIPFMPDIIWASPPCTTYSIAAISHHRNSRGGAYKTMAAKTADLICEKVWEIISWFPKATYFIENPVGLMRKMPFMLWKHKATVTYCQYGGTNRKPTDIFTNSTTWKPRRMCKNGDSCHEAAPRGSRTGTQGKKGAYERSKIPEQLCREILMSCTGAKE